MMQWRQTERRGSSVRGRTRGIAAWSGGMGVGVSVLLLIGAAGCGVNIVPPDDGEVVDGNRGAISTTVAGKTSGEPDDSFADAIIAVFDDAGVARLQGTVASVGDLDVFTIGLLSAGDRVIVDTDASGSALDVSVAIFDAEQRLVYNNDDRNDSTAQYLDSYIDWVVRHDSNTSYLVVTHSAFAASGQYVGTYRVDVSVAGGSPVPEPVGQVLLLNFDGGQVTIPGMGRMTLLPFDAADISSVYEGETETIKASIRAVFEQNFNRFEVTIRTTDDAPLPEGALYSTVHFGGFDAEAFGIADSVDLYNVDFCDDAIIFTESFEPYIFTITPTAAELGIAIGNVGSHEAGHLLGLNHVDDDTDLMDDVSGADAFLDNQEFKEAPLSSDIMPIGVQDAVLLLDEIVGPVPGF